MWKCFKSCIRWDRCDFRCSGSCCEADTVTEMGEVTGNARKVKGKLGAWLSGNTFAWQAWGLELHPQVHKKEEKLKPRNFLPWGYCNWLRKSQALAKDRNRDSSHILPIFLPGSPGGIRHGLSAPGKMPGTSFQFVQITRRKWFVFWSSHTEHFALKAHVRFCAKHTWWEGGVPWISWGHWCHLLGTFLIQ
jgi:hypothetical protein